MSPAPSHFFLTSHHLSPPHPSGFDHSMEFGIPFGIGQASHNALLPTLCLRCPTLPPFAFALAFGGRREEGEETLHLHACLVWEEEKDSVLSCPYPLFLRQASPTHTSVSPHTPLPLPTCHTCTPPHTYFCTFCLPSAYISGAALFDMHTLFSHHQPLSFMLCVLSSIHLNLSSHPFHRLSVVCVWDWNGKWVNKTCIAPCMCGLRRRRLCGDSEPGPQKGSSPCPSAQPADVYFEKEFPLTTAPVSPLGKKYDLCCWLKTLDRRQLLLPLFRFLQWEEGKGMCRQPRLRLSFTRRLSVSGWKPSLSHVCACSKLWPLWPLWEALVEAGKASQPSRMSFSAAKHCPHVGGGRQTTYFLSLS